MAAAHASAAGPANVSVAAQPPRLPSPEAQVFTWNPQSMRVLEKAGFTREAVLRSAATKDGQLIDTVLYARVFVPR